MPWACALRPCPLLGGRDADSGAAVFGGPGQTRGPAGKGTGASPRAGALRRRQDGERGGRAPPRAGKKRALHEGRAKKCVSLWGDFLKLDGSFKAVDKRQVHRENDRIYVMSADRKSKIFRKMRDGACRNVPQFLRVYVAALSQGWYKIPVDPEITPVHTDGMTCRRHKDGIGLVRADEQCRASFGPCCFQWAESLQPMAPAGSIESSK